MATIMVQSHNARRDSGSLMLQRLRTYFLAGLVVVAPIFITGYLTWLFIDTVDMLVVRNLPPRYNPETYLPFSIPGLGVLIMGLFLILIGAFAANFAGRAMIGVGENLLDRMPVIRSIYSTLKQIVETIMAQHSTSFRSVVLVEYPRKGLWALAFVSTEAKGEVQTKTASKTLNVFLPTTPNPTSGYLLFVPEEDCIVLDMSVEQAVKYIISAGLVAPADDPEALVKRLNGAAGQAVGGGGKNSDAKPSVISPPVEANDPSPTSASEPPHPAQTNRAASE